MIAKIAILCENENEWKICQTILYNINYHWLNSNNVSYLLRFHTKSVIYCEPLKILTWSDLEYFQKEETEEYKLYKFINFSRKLKLEKLKNETNHM